MIAAARKAVLTLVIVLLAVWPACGQPQSTIEQQVKGAFLTKFPLFIDWPAGTFASASSPIVIGILGKNPFGDGFEQEVGRQKARDRSFQLKLLRGLDGLKECHILYIHPEQDGRLAEVLARLGHAPVLIAGDAASFVERGGMINFIKREGKVRFQVNLEAVRAAGLRIDARLLQVSEVIKPPKSKPTT